MSIMLNLKMFEKQNNDIFLTNILFIFLLKSNNKSNYSPIIYINYEFYICLIMEKN